MNFRDEVVSHFMDEEGLVSVDRDPARWSTGNGLLHTGLFYTLLKLRGELDAGTDVGKFDRAVNRCWTDLDGLPVQGCLERNDGRKDLEAQDDYVGVMAASYHLRTQHAGLICLFGEEHGWCYDNQNPLHPALRTCHLRFPGLVGFYRIAAGKSPGWAQIPLLAASILANSFSPKDATTGKMLTWLIVGVVREKNWLIDRAISIWERRMRSQYETLGKLFEPYFGASHPLSTVGWECSRNA